MFGSLGISDKVYYFGEEILQDLTERFDSIDETVEYNQLKVIRAMQENRVNAECFNFTLHFLHYI